MTSRRVLVAALAVALVAAVAGCASIPSSGGVDSAGRISSTVNNDIEFLPNEPVAGSDQERIIRDFVDAGTGPQNNFAVAREFLTTSFAKKWNPDAGAIVSQGSGTPFAISPTQYTYTLTSSATVDASGHYTQALSATSTTLSFKLVKQGGQWRISYAPPGIVLSTANFDLIYQPHALYFFDPTYTYLVPDERWFLARGSTTTRIAETLLEGPSKWLQGAVVSAFPEGTQLALNSVTVDSGTARVDLTNDALSADAVARSRMRAQLVASLATIATVSAVDISVDSTPLSIPDDAGTAPTKNPSVDSRALVLQKGQFGFADSSGVTPIAGLGKAVAGLSPTSVEVSSKLSEAAVGTGSGVYSVAADGTTKTVDTRSGLVGPTLDDFGFVWSAPSTSPRSIQVTGSDGVAHTVVSSLPSDETLIAMSMSRDDTRLALLLDDDGTTRLLVTSVVRDAQHVPVSLGGPLELTPPSGDPLDVTWIDDVTIATLSTDAAGDSLVSSHEIGGESTDLGRPTGQGVAIVGGNGLDGMRVITAAGEILEPRGSGWQDEGITADLLATQH